jgi:protein tyrosine/serine phosphatase
VTDVDRHLSWDRCVNVRDLGGQPTADGRTTAMGAVVRADTLDHLTSRGWEALLAHGVRTIVDLRATSERRTRPLPEGLEELHVPLLEEADFGALDGIPTMEGRYLHMLERRPAAFVEAVGAVAGGFGAAVVHCYAGKDRTGLVVALALTLVGVGAGEVADDYAASHQRVQPLLAEWIDAAPTPGERWRRTYEGSARRETMLRTLELLETRFGGAESYLRAAGASGTDVEALRLRLLG